jgi:hypothetical protein
VQEEEEIGPALSHRTERLKDNKVKSVKEVHHPPHGGEQEVELDTNVDLSTLFQDRVERSRGGRDVP